MGQASLILAIRLTETDEYSVHVTMSIVRYGSENGTHKEHIKYRDLSPQIAFSSTSWLHQVF